MLLRLLNWRSRFARARAGGYCVLVSPEFSEAAWLDRIPTRGTRLRRRGGHEFWGRTWVVDDVLQSGINTYTVFLVDRRQYVRSMRQRSETDLAAELLELARRTRDTVDERRERWGRRDYLP